MKFAGGIFTSMLVLSAMGAAVSIKRYAQPAPLCTIKIVSASASDQVRSHAQLMTFAYQGVSFYPQHLISLVQESFPALKKIAVHKTSRGYTVTVKQQKPLCLINQTQVLTQEGQYVDKQQFDPKLIATLLAYTITQQPQQTTHDQVQFARSFDTDIVRDYTVAWCDASRVELCDKQDPSLMLIVSADMSLSADLFKAYQEVKKELKALPAGKKGRVWRVDMRFKNQILVC